MILYTCVNARQDLAPCLVFKSLSVFPRNPKESSVIFFWRLNLEDTGGQLGKVLGISRVLGPWFVWKGSDQGKRSFWASAERISVYFIRCSGLRAFHDTNHFG